MCILGIREVHLCVSLERLTFHYSSKTVLTIKKIYKYSYLHKYTLIDEFKKAVLETYQNWSGMASTPQYEKKTISTAQVKIKFVIAECWGKNFNLIGKGKKGNALNINI